MGQVGDELNPLLFVEPDTSKVQMGTEARPVSLTVRGTTTLSDKLTIMTGGLEIKNGDGANRPLTCAIFSRRGPKPAALQRRAPKEERQKTASRAQPPSGSTAQEVVTCCLLCWQSYSATPM